MNEPMDKVLSTSQNSKKKFSMSKEVKENDLTKCIRVREIENGFLVTYSKYGYADDDPEHKTYIDESFEKYSEKNPFAEDTNKEENETDALVDLFNPPIK